MSIDENKLENDLAVDGISEDAEELENELVEDQQVEDEEILEACRFAWENDFASVVLQSGEISSPAFIKRMDNLLKKIKQRRMTSLVYFIYLRNHWWNDIGQICMLFLQDLSLMPGNLLGSTQKQQIHWNPWQKSSMTMKILNHRI